MVVDRWVVIKGIARRSGLIIAILVLLCAPFFMLLICVGALLERIGNWMQNIVDI